MTEQELYEVFNKLRYHYENEVVEFKKAENNFDFDDLGKYFSALSNEANLRDKDFAWLVFGVENKSREILGTTYKNSMTSLQKLKHDLGQHTTDRNTFRDIFELKVEGKRVLMFQVPAAPRGIPISWKGHFYARRGESLTALDIAKYEEIRRQTLDEDWSKQIVKGATMDDLDPEAIKKAREKYAQKHPGLAEEMKKWDDVTFLNKAKITTKGKITNTAILLVGRTESEYLISPSVARIRWIYKDSTGTERDFAIETCPFVLATDVIYDKIRNFKYLMMNRELASLVPDNLDTYDPFIIREALNNAIAHQDYGCQGMINVVEEEDRLVFTNLGSFIPDSVRSVLENDAPEEHYRNKMLANAMVELGMVDTIGSGIKRMFDKQRERLFPMPDYDFRDNRVKVTIVGKVLDVDYAMLLNKLPEALTEKQKLSKIGNLLTYLRKNGKIELLENKMWARKFS